MTSPTRDRVRGLVHDLRAVAPDSGVAAVLRTVAESARRAARARLAVIVPAPTNPLIRLITVAVDGYDDVPEFDAQGAIELSSADDRRACHLTLDGRKMIRVPINAADAEFCVLYLADPVDPEGFGTESISWLDDIAAVAGMAVEHSIYNEEHGYRAQWASTFEALNRGGASQQVTSVLQEIAQTAMRLSKTQCAAVATPTGEFVEVRAAAGLHADRLRGSIAPAGLSMMGQVIATLRYDHVDDASNSERTFVPLSQAVELGPAVVVPLQHAGTPIGSLLLGNQQGGAPVDVSKIVEHLSTDPRLRHVIRFDDAESQRMSSPLAHLRGTSLWDERLEFLTRRELIVLGMLGEGKANSAIAEELFLSDKTVRNYVSNTLTKLNMRRVEAAVFASNLLGALEPAALKRAP